MATIDFEIVDNNTSVEMEVEGGNEVQLETDEIAPHSHDDRYYTEAETNALLAGKSDVGHNHDGRYYTETETNALLAGKSDTGHTHDDRYYTETETNGLLAGKSDINHNHDGRYYTEGEVDTLLSGKANAVHNHDDRYYTESEVDAAIDDVREIAAGKSKNYGILATSNPEFNTQDSQISIASFVDVSGVTHQFTELKIGDNVLVGETDLPDRWVSSIGTTSATLMVLETSKVPVIDVRKNNVSLVTNNVANIPNSLSDYSDDATHRLVTDTEKSTWNSKQSAIDSSHKLSADLVDDGATNKVVTQTEKTAWNGKADIDDSSTASNKVWSASKVNALVGDVESLLEALL